MFAKFKKMQYNTFMDEFVRRANYIGSKYLLNNIKFDVRNILNKEGVLKSYGISPGLKDVIEKFYYDTPELFFRNNGINICVNKYNNKSYCDIVIRYDSLVPRIAFLSNLPDTLIKKINKNDNISRHFNYIAQAIGEIFPKGLNVDVFEVVKKLKIILTVIKRRERYRIIHNNGLKMVFSFESCDYINKTRDKVKLDILEIRMESEGQAELFKKFVHSLELQESKLIKLKHSDLFIGQDYLNL